MGYGLVEEQVDGRAHLLTWGVLTVRPQLSLGERLHSLYRQLLELMELYVLHEVAVEAPFVSVNPRTSMAIGQAQGVTLMAAAALNIPITGYSPLQVKQAVTGHGSASKEQVQQAVAMHLLLEPPHPPEDAADALAVALCHLQSHRAAGVLYSGT